MGRRGRRRRRELQQQAKTTPVSDRIKAFGTGFCSECPDHEACSQGAACIDVLRLLRQATKPFYVGDVPVDADAWHAPGVVKDGPKGPPGTVAPVSVGPASTGARIEADTGDPPVRMYGADGRQLVPIPPPPPTKRKHRPNCFAQPWRDGKEESCNCGGAVTPPLEAVPADLLRRAEMRLHGGQTGKTAAQRGLLRELRAQGWTVIQTNGSNHIRAYPPGPIGPSWAHVPLPVIVDGEHQLANTIAALRRIGPFTWEGR